jgi:hypothetical protein
LYSGYRNLILYPLCSLKNYSPDLIELIDELPIEVAPIRLPVALNVPEPPALVRLMVAPLMLLLTEPPKLPWYPLKAKSAVWEPPVGLMVKLFVELLPVASARMALFRTLAAPFVDTVSVRPMAKLLILLPTLAPRLLW